MSLPNILPYGIIGLVIVMIKQYRIKKGYTQEELAEMVNLSTRQLQRIEENEERTKIKTLKQIIKVLQIPENEIIDFMNS